MRSDLLAPGLSSRGQTILMKNTHSPDNAALGDRTIHILDGALPDDPASPGMGAVRRQTGTKTVVR